MKFDPNELTVIIDSREQNPFDLSPMRTIRGTLYTGDYSIQGMEHIISLERKSLGDLVSCVGRERARFERELSRLRGFPVSAIVVEASWAELESGAWMTAQSKITPNHVLGSITSWIAQGHSIIVAPRPMAQRIGRSILQHAARNRFEEVKGLFGMAKA